MVYLDESGFASEMQKERAWSKIGSPVIAERSGQRQKRINLFCALNHKFEAIAPFLTEENCKAENFESWFELQFLHALSLPSDAVIVMDNARFHRKSYLFDFIKDFNSFYKTQLSILFLPPYSPDLNPIEHYFAVLKGKVKQMAVKNSLTMRERLQAALEI